MTRLAALLLCLLPVAVQAQHLWETVGGGLSRMPLDIHTDTAQGRILLGGEFKYANGMLVNQSVAWDGQNWQPLGLGAGYRDSCPPVSLCATVGHILDFDGEVYAGGTFYLHEDSTWHVNDIIRFEGTSWQSCVSTNSSSMPYTCNGRLFTLGWNMQSLNGIPVNNVAAWEDSAWVALSGAMDFEGGGLTTMEYFQGDYYFGGNFGHSSDFKEIVRWDGQDWHPVGSGLLGDSWVDMMKAYKGLLYVGGEFYEADGNADDHLMAWDGHQWWPTFPDVRFVQQVRKMEVIDDKLYLVGMHYVFKDGAWLGPYAIAKWDGENFCSFGGLNMQITEVAGLNGDIYVVSNPLASPDSILYFGRYLGGPSDEICLPQLLPNAISDIYSEHAITVHPNPASNVTTVQWIADPGAAADLRLFGSDGRLVREWRIDSVERVSFSINLDLQGISSGVYFLQIANGDKLGRVRILHY